MNLLRPWWSLVFSLFVLLAPAAKATLSLTNFDDRFFLVNFGEMVPLVPIDGYKVFSRERSGWVPQFVKTTPLLAIPFAANVSPFNSERLFPVIRFSTVLPAHVEIGFAIEVLDVDPVHPSDDPATITPDFGMSEKIRDRIYWVLESWKAKVDTATRMHLKTDIREWGQIPHAGPRQEGFGDYLATCLVRVNTATLGLRQVNALILGLDQALVQQGCEGALTVFESPRGSVR